MARTKYAGIERRVLASGAERFDVRYRLPSGKSRTKTTTTITAAREFQATVLAQRARGGLVDPKAGRVTLADYSERWLDGKPELRASTVDMYRGILRLHLLPELGRVQLSRLDVATVRSWRADRLRHVGPGTVAKSYRVLRAILNTAVADGLIVTNPCQINGAGQEHHEERSVVGPAEVWALADEVDPRWRCMVLLAGFCGLRLGEVLGLAVRHVDLLHGTVTVERQLQEIGRSGSQVFAEPKSKRGRRALVLPAAVAKELRQHLEQMPDAGSDSLLFTGAQGGPLRRYRWNQEWTRARTAAGHPTLRFHDLRHSAMTLFAATGATIAELQAQAGHASSAAAMRYQHATHDRAVALAELVDRVITAPPEGERAMDAR
ncbi:tyrosine-type recombinase/integrase [Aquihabitans sp. McL0605]|uniref:tyrosine-type recombinase/integrase n=1 Tax=Aquihabitans sp. McL0605 TaxID=3415671 RepID=UPI003CF620FB